MNNSSFKELLNSVNQEHLKRVEKIENEKPKNLTPLFVENSEYSLELIIKYHQWLTDNYVLIPREDQGKDI